MMVVKRTQMRRGLTTALLTLIGCVPVHTQDSWDLANCSRNLSASKSLAGHLCTPEHLEADLALLRAGYTEEVLTASGPLLISMLRGWAETGLVELATAVRQAEAARAQASAIAALDAVQGRAPADQTAGRPSAGSFVALGFGTASCGQWTTAKTTRTVPLAAVRVAMANWVEGFLTATGMVSAMFAGSPNDSDQFYAAMFRQRRTDSEAVLQWMDQHCAEHPLELLHEASQQLMLELQPK